MFLQPQHFQQQDGYHEARVRHYLHWLAPFAWGIKSLSSVRLRCRTTCVTLSGVNWSPGRGRLCVFGEHFPQQCGASTAFFCGRAGYWWPPLGGSWAQAAALGREACLEAGVACPAGRGMRRCRLQAAEVLDLLAAEGQRCTVPYLLYWARTISSTAL